MPTTLTTKATTPIATIQTPTTIEELTTIDFSEATSDLLIAESSKDVKSKIR